MSYKNQIASKDNKKFAKIITAQPDGLSGEKITVEIDISRGIYSFVIIGLADKSIEESRDRVTSAIKHSGFPSPKRKIQKNINRRRKNCFKSIKEYCRSKFIRLK